MASEVASSGDVSLELLICFGGAWFSSIKGFLEALTSVLTYMFMRIFSGKS